MKLSRGVARFNRRVTNRIQGVYAWLVPPWAVIVHRGRRSGRQYRTPLFAFRRDRTLVIAVLYGQESDWLRNLRAGGGQVIRAGRTFTVRQLEVIDTSGAGPLLARLSPPERAYCRLAEKLAILELGEQLPGCGPRPRQWTRVTRSSTRPGNGKCGARQTCRFS
jgi:deazaflavin-dependent oxidoreductase (nitroreductase family)